MKFSIVTLGCKVNSYESNVVRDIFLNAGYIEESNNVDVVIINTCTVTDTADSKSLKVIRQQIRKNPNSVIVVIFTFLILFHISFLILQKLCSINYKFKPYM